MPCPVEVPLPVALIIPKVTEKSKVQPKSVYGKTKLKAEKIIYVSCNPTTQARDAKILYQNGYEIRKAVMVDMFPHTPHIETVVLFSK